MSKKQDIRVSSVSTNLVDARAKNLGAEAYSRDKYVSKKPASDANSTDTDSTTTTSSTEASKYSKMRKKRKRNKIIKIAACTILVLIIAAGAGVFAYAQYLNSKMMEGVDDSLREALSSTDSPTDPFYMLLLGVDGSLERDNSSEFAGGSYRCDSIILTRVDPKNKKVTLISLPRDLQITNMGGTTENPTGYGTQKLNAAHAYGGPALVVSTVSKIANVPISHYVEINFDGFIQAVDSVGGVEVDVKYAIDKSESQTGWDVPAGLQTLNGYQALSLCRSRHSYDYLGDGDALRTANQRAVMTALAKKILSSDLPTILNTVNGLVQYVLTDMDLGTIAGLAQSLQGIDPSNMYTGSMPKVSNYVDGVWWDFVYQDKWDEMMKRVNQGLSPTESEEVDASTGIVLSSGDGTNSASGGTKPSISTASIAVRNGTSTQGLATKAVEKLKNFGYTNVEGGNADSTTYATTQIIYKSSTYETDANTIAKQLGCGTVQADDGTYLMTSNILVVVGADYTGE